MADRNGIILRKMIDHASDAQLFADGFDFADFAADKRTLNACVFSLSQLGELSRHLSKEFRDAHTEIPWHSLYNLRNRIVHDYDGIRIDVIWQTIQYHVPEVITDLRAILKEAAHDDA